MSHQKPEPDTVLKNREFSKRKDSIKYSVSNYRFNVYDDVWVLNHDTYFHIDVSCVNRLTFEVQQRIRKGFAKLAETKPVYAAHQGSLKKLVSCIDYDIDIKAIKRFIDLSHQLKSDAGISTGKQILSRIAILYPEEYFESNVYLQKVRTRQSSPKHLDPERGCLNEREELLILNAINASGATLKQTNADWLQWRNHHHIRFINCTNRRPVQLVQLKWCDLSTEKHPLSNTFVLKMPLSKQLATNPFREAFESSPVPILADVYSEIIQYRNQYFSTFESRLLELGINLSLTEKSDLFPRLPIFPESELFEIDVADKPQLFRLFSQEQEIYHLSRDKFKSKFQELFKKFNIKSDRTKKFYYGIHRQKHTIGTKLGIKGEHDTIIAGVLGHTTTKAVHKYCEVTPEMMMKINNNASAFENISLAFQGKLIDKKLIKNFKISAITSEDMFDIGCGNKCCETCELERPYSCYPCPFFRPVADADHQSVWNEYLCMYQTREKAGATPEALQSMRVTLQYIAATIKACKSFSKNLGVDKGGKS